MQDTLAHIPHPTSPPIYNDIMWIGLFCALVIYLLWTHRQRSTLSNTALMAIGSWSMFWQEFYSNWGGYLLYSPDLNLMPWGSTWWTAPNKPWFMLFSYPVFYTVIYSLLLLLVRRLQRLLPHINLYVLVMLVAPPLFYFYNLVVDGASVNAGMWTYVDVMGPYLVTRSGGLEPLVWPMIPFAIYGGLMVCSLLKPGQAGQPFLLRYAHAERYSPGFKRESVRVIASIAYWNLMYWCFMTFPINLGRELFGGPSILVP